ncbi:MAG: Ig-like domain-containing protein [Verrucomicrobiota bacterium]
MTFCAAALCPARSQTIDPAYTNTYSLRNIGPAPGVPLPNGGMIFKAGDTNTLLLGGNAATPSAAIYQVGVTRGAGNHLTGFTGQAAFVANAGSADDGIMDSLAYGPNGCLFFTLVNDVAIGEIAPGATTVSRIVPLSSMGIQSLLNLTVVPSGMPGAGRLNVQEFSWSQWHEMKISLNADGITYNIVTNGVDIEEDDAEEGGATYLTPGHPGFPNGGVLVGCITEFIGYTLDGNSDPVPGTSVPIVENMLAAGQAGFDGMTADPATEDILFMYEGNIYVMTASFPLAPPTASITTPANNANCLDTGFTFSATASQSNGAISELDVYDYGTNIVDTFYQPPYSAPVNLPDGAHALTAVVTSGDDQMATSAVVNITVTSVPLPPPVVQLISPASNSAVCDCWPIELVAAATSPQGVALVQFYNNGTNYLGQSTNAPYEVSFPNLRLGTLALTAIATDTTGLSTVSAVVNTTVTNLALLELEDALTANDLCELCFRGNPGSNYVFLAGTNLLSSGTWTPLSTNMASSSLIFYTDPSPLGAKRFYRARQQ